MLDFTDKSPFGFDRSLLARKQTTTMYEFLTSIPYWLIAVTFVGCAMMLTMLDTETTDEPEPFAVIYRFRIWSDDGRLLAEDDWWDYLWESEDDDHERVRFTIATGWVTHESNVEIWDVIDPTELA